MRKVRRDRANRNPGRRDKEHRIRIRKSLLRNRCKRVARPVSFGIMCQDPLSNLRSLRSVTVIRVVERFFNPRQKTGSSHACHDDRHTGKAEGTLFLHTAVCRVEGRIVESGTLIGLSEAVPDHNERRVIDSCPLHLLRKCSHRTAQSKFILPGCLVDHRHRRIRLIAARQKLLPYLVRQCRA